MNITIKNTYYSYNGYDIQIDNEMHYGVLASTGGISRQFYSEKKNNIINTIVIPYLNCFCDLYILETKNIFILNVDEDLRKNVTQIIKTKKESEIIEIEEKFKILDVKIFTNKLSRFSFLQDIKEHFNNRLSISEAVS